MRSRTARLVVLAVILTGVVVLGIVTMASGAPATTAYGSLHGLRPHGTADQVCTRVGAGIGGNACTGTLNVTLPRTFPEARWMCAEFAVLVHGKWVDNGAGLAHGLRACSHVH